MSQGRPRSNHKGVRCVLNSGGTTLAVRIREAGRTSQRMWQRRANEGFRNSWATITCMADDTEISALRVSMDDSAKLAAGWPRVAAPAGCV